MDVTLSTILLALVAFPLASMTLCHYDRYNGESTLEECSAGCCFYRDEGVYPCCTEDDPEDDDPYDFEIDLAPIIAPAVVVPVMIIIICFVIIYIARRRRLQNQGCGITYNARNNPHGISIGQTYVPPAGYTTVVNNPSGNMAMRSNTLNTQQGQPLLVYHQHPTVCHQYSHVFNQNPTVHNQNPPTVHYQNPTVHNQNPIVHYQNPTVHNQNPIVHYQNPTVHNQNPTVHDQQPTAHPTVHGQPPSYAEIMNNQTEI